METETSDGTEDASTTLLEPRNTQDYAQYPSIAREKIYTLYRSIKQDGDGQDDQTQTYTSGKTKTEYNR